jgi:hypothetical protein
MRENEFPVPLCQIVKDLFLLARPARKLSDLSNRLSDGMIMHAVRTSNGSSDLKTSQNQVVSGRISYLPKLQSWTTVLPWAIPRNFRTKTED